MKTETLFEEILAAIENMDSDELLTLHNEYCDAANDPDGVVYPMYELNDLLTGRTPEEILDLLTPSNRFSTCDDYFSFDGYGFLVSANEWDACRWVYPSDIARYVVDNGDALNNDTLQEILDESENQ